jgi:hypothetical protein
MSHSGATRLSRSLTLGVALCLSMLALSGCGLMGTAAGMATKAVVKTIGVVTGDASSQQQTEPEGTAVGAAEATSNAG